MHVLNALKNSRDYIVKEYFLLQNMSEIQKIPTKRKSKRKTDVLPKVTTKESEEYNVNTVTDEYPVYRITQSEDFNSLLQKPVCSDSFFKLKSEQNWECERNPQNQLCNYFKLNLERLNAGANCLPISKRHDIDESIFLINDSNHFNKREALNLQKYQNYLDQYKKKLKNDKPVEKNISRDVTSTTCKETIVEVAVSLNPADENNHKVQVSQSTEDDLDELLHLKISACTEDKIVAEDPLLDTNITLIPKISTKPTDDLEDWLDDILDN